MKSCDGSADIKICEPDKQAKLDAPAARPNDPLVPQQWALPAINMNGAWSAVRVLVLIHTLCVWRCT